MRIVRKCKGIIYSISKERVLASLFKWKGIWISVLCVVASVWFIALTYGEDSKCSELVYDIAVSIFTGALFAMVTFLLELELGKKKEKRQINSIISRYHNDIDEKIFKLDFRCKGGCVSELHKIRELIGSMNLEICDCDIIYYTKAHQINEFLVKLLLVMDRYLEIIEKCNMETETRKQEELFNRLMSKLIVEENVEQDELKRMYPFKKFCSKDLDEVDKIVLNGKCDLEMDKRLKLSDDYDFSHGTVWSASEGMKKRYTIVNYYIFHMLPKEKYFFVSKNELQ